MTGIGILIPGTGPGTGPILPAPLHEYGRTDATHRYVGARLGDLGSVVTEWRDSIGTADLATPSGGTQLLTVAAGPVSKSVIQPNIAITLPQVQRLFTAPADTTIRTVVMVCKTPTVDGTRILWSGDLWKVARASNGQMGISPRSGSGGSGGVFVDWTSDWEVIAATCDPSTGETTIKRRGATAREGTLTLGTASTKNELFSGDLVARDSSVAELITFGTVLSSEESEDVMQILATHYGIA